MLLLNQRSLMICACMSLVILMALGCDDGKDDSSLDNNNSGAITISASSGSNGRISPSGTVIVKGGADQAFAVTPDAGYVVDAVLVDGVSVGAVNSYTFNAVAVSHTIAVSFKPSPPTGFKLLVTGTPGRPISAQALAHPQVGGFLIHQGWKDIETSKGVFDWSYIDSEFAVAVANSKRVRTALHIGGRDAPKWLYDDEMIPFILGKHGQTFNHVGELTFSANTISCSTAVWPGDLGEGRIIEITGTPNNNGRYRIVSDTTNSITVEESFTSETNVGGTVSVDVVPCFWDAAVIQHKSDFYNALLDHLGAVSQATLDASITMPISMVDPNTGDWSFVNSPHHIASYEAAGWLNGNESEKLAGLGKFEAAMRTLYNNVVPNVPSTMYVSSAVGPVPQPLLPDGVNPNTPANRILDYVEAQYPGKLIIGKGALNARTYYVNPCPAIGSPWEKICVWNNFLQINWSVSSSTYFKANGNHEWDRTNYKATATILKNSGLCAYSYNALWYEIWHADVDSSNVLSNPALKSELDIAMAYINDLFIHGNPVVGPPIAVQVPLASIVAPLGTDFVLQYVFDYNGEVPDLFEVKKDGVVVGNDLSFVITNPSVGDSGDYEISCRNSEGTTTVSTTITFE